jgi:hypothetical protein
MRIFPTHWFASSPMVKQFGAPQTYGIETLTPIRLRSGDKLLLLRRLDHLSAWESLDDKRQCLRCRTVFSGRQLDVVGGTRGLGPLRLLCPTEGCPSTASDWVGVTTKQRPRASQASSLNGTMDAAHSGSMIGVMRKRGAHSKAKSPALLPMSLGGALEAGPMKKLARLLHPARARG